MTGETAQLEKNAEDPSGSEPAGLPSYGAASLGSRQFSSLLGVWRYESPDGSFHRYWKIVSTQEPGEFEIAWYSTQKGIKDSNNPYQNKVVVTREEACRRLLSKIRGGYHHIRGDQPPFSGPTVAEVLSSDNTERYPMVKGIKSPLEQWLES